MGPGLDDPWPDSDAELAALQERLANAVASPGVEPPLEADRIGLVGGCFVAFAQGEQGPGHPGDRAWAGAVSWRVGDGITVAEHVVADRVPAAYAPGLLARREGPILHAAVAGLVARPDLLLVDATGWDHPRRAGLAVHLGAALELPTVGVTHRGLVVRGDPGDGLSTRGDHEVVRLGGQEVAAWVCTRSGARPLLVHAGWRSDVVSAVEVVLRCSTEAARTPIPLREARRVARTARHELGS